MYDNFATSISEYNINLILSTIKNQYDDLVKMFFKSKFMTNNKFKNTFYQIIVIILEVVINFFEIKDVLNHHRNIIYKIKKNFKKNFKTFFTLTMFHILTRSIINLNDSN